MKSFALAAASLTLGFLLPLWKLARFAAGDELHSYILLMPAVGAYLVWIEKEKLPRDFTPAKKIAASFFAAGVFMTVWHWLAPRAAVSDNLAQTTLAFLLLLTGAGFWILGGAVMRAVAFPFALLGFMIPFPVFLRDVVEAGLQHGSAVVAGWMFAVSDVPVLQDSVAFRLPGISLQVAPECSGIHSTVVLFITSLVAGHFFLRSRWKRAALCLAVIPLALLRNGFRVFVLGELCTHIGPEMIDSPIHHHGGPLFFALSLLPFLLLLYWLKRSERAAQACPEKNKFAMKNTMRSVLLFAVALALVLADTGCTAKVKKAYHESRADKFFAAGQFDRAEIEYLNVLRSDNGSVKAFTRLGEIYFQQGRYQMAAPFVERASNLATNALDLRVKLAMINIAAGQFKAARYQVNFILDCNPQQDDAPLLLAQSAHTPPEFAAARARLEKLAKAGDRASIETALGTLALRENDLKTASVNLKRALEIDPKSADALEALGALFAAQNDLKGAEANFKSASDLSPVRSTKRMLYARFKLMTGDIAGAKQILEETVRQAADYVPALMGLAEISLAQKNLADCQLQLTKVLSRDPDSFDGLLLDSRLKYARGEIGGAVVTLERMAKIYPQSSRVQFQLGAAYLAAAEDTKATVALGRALELDPNFSEAVLLLSEIQVKNGNADPAIVALSKFTDPKLPQYEHARLLLADAYRLRGRVDEALAIYLALEKTSPQNPQIPLLIGSALIHDGDHARARQEFERSLALAPTNLPPLEQLVNLDLADKNFPAAMQRVAEKLKANPNKLGLHLLVAKVQLAAGQRDEAEKTLLHAAEIEPQNEAPSLLLAQFYVDGKQKDKAAQMLQAAIGKNPRNLSAQMLLAGMSEADKDYQGAAAIYEKMLQLDPKCGPALNNVAYLYSEFLGQLDRAYELAQRARDLSPFDPSTADTLGWICLKRGAYPAAVSLLQESAAKLVGQPEAIFHFGLANYMVLNEAAARTAFQNALSDGKDFRGRDECQLCLALLDIDPQSADATAITKLEQRAAEKPEDLVAQSRLAVIYQRAGKTDKAINSFEAVLKTDSKNLVALNGLAKLYETKDAAKAINYAKSAYKIAPNDVDTTHLYGRLAYQNGDYKLANTMLQNAAQRQPGNVALQFDFARAAYAFGKYFAAQTALAAAVSGGLPAPAAAEAKRMAEMLALANTPMVSAAGRVADILKAEPDYVPALMAQAKLDELAGNAAGASAACEKALAHFPDFAPAQRELAILYSRDAAKSQQAYVLAMKARDDFPGDLPLMKATGIIVFQQGDFARAVSLLKDVVAKSDADAEIFYYLGAAQAKVKDKAAAKTSLQKSLALNAVGPLADAAKKILTELK
jgi:exosortase C (VPDSG-CTERM-specific)